MKDDRLYLIHISECIERIESYVTGRDNQVFPGHWDGRIQQAEERGGRICPLPCWESEEALSE